MLRYCNTKQTEKKKEEYFKYSYENDKILLIFLYCYTIEDGWEQVYKIKIFVKEKFRINVTLISQEDFV